MAGIRDNSPTVVNDTGRRATMRRFYAKLRTDPVRYAKHLEDHKIRSRKNREKMKAIRPDGVYYTRRTYILKRKYGLTRDQYETLLDQHGRACAICGGKNRLHVDHSHEDGHVRGILCGICNPALGLLGDNIQGLERALRYLQERC